jgi:hypothetical protein
MSQYINQFDYKQEDDLPDSKKIIAYVKSIRSLLIYVIILLIVNGIINLVV